jgi:hypothetical protein
MAPELSQSQRLSAEGYYFIYLWYVRIEVPVNMRLYCAILIYKRIVNIIRLSCVLLKIIVFLSFLPSYYKLKGERMKSARKTDIQHSKKAQLTHFLKVPSQERNELSSFGSDFESADINNASTSKSASVGRKFIIMYSHGYKNWPPSMCQWPARQYSCYHDFDIYFHHDIIDCSPSHAFRTN